MTKFTGTGRTMWSDVTTEKIGPTGEVWIHRWCHVCKKITQHTKLYGYAPVCDEHQPPAQQRKLF